jgi:hypothetical protein
MRKCGYNRYSNLLYLFRAYTQGIKKDHHPLIKEAVIYKLFTRRIITGQGWINLGLTIEIS